MDFRASYRGSKKISLGIRIPSNSEAGGVCQYAQSMVESVYAVEKDFHFDISIVYEIDSTSASKKFPCLPKCIENKTIITFSKSRSLDRRLMSLISLFGPSKILNKYLFSKIELLEGFDFFLVPYIETIPHLFLGKPFIFTLHDLQEKHFPYFFSAKERFLRQLANRILCLKAKHILCESHFVKNDIIENFQVQPDKITVCQAPPLKLYDLNLINPANFDQVRKRYNIKLPYIFYPAQFWPHKNHLNLLEAFKRISLKYSDLILVLCGAELSAASTVRKKIKQLDLESKVLLLGYVPDEDLPYLYKMSLFLIMPSLYESISIPIYEAFSLEVPVCASNTGAIPQQVGGAALLFQPKNIEDIYSKIKILLEDKNKRESLAKMGKRRLDQLNHKNFGAHILRLIEQCL